MKMNKGEKNARRFFQVIGYSIAGYILILITMFIGYSGKSTTAHSLNVIPDEQFKMILIGVAIVILPITWVVLKFSKWKGEDFKEMHQDYLDRQKINKLLNNDKGE